MDLTFAGKHRGIVENNADPMKLGRLKIRVPAAYGDQPVSDLPWAWPCFPSGGGPDCGFFAVPEVGAAVWVEFLWQEGQPDPSLPVWSGVWFPVGGTPKEVLGPPEDAHFYTVLKTARGCAITLCDKPGKQFIKIKTPNGSLIEIDKAGHVVTKATMGSKTRLQPKAWEEDH